MSSDSDALIAAINIANTESTARLGAAGAMAHAQIVSVTEAAATEAQAKTAAAQFALQAAVQSAQIQYSGVVQASANQANAVIQAAGDQQAAAITSAGLQAGATTAAAGAQAAAITSAAASQAGAIDSAAATQAGATISAAAAQAAATTAAAGIMAGATGAAAATHTAGMIGAAEASAGGAIGAAGAEAAGHIGAAAASAAGNVSAATASAAGQVSAAEASANGVIGAAGLHADAQISSATLESAAQTASAKLHADAQLSSAEASAAAQVTSAQSSADGSVAAATAHATGMIQAAQATATAQVSSATIDASWHQGVATTELTGVEYRADKDYAAAVYHETAETARLNLKLDFANDKFNVLLPVIDQALGIVSGSGGSSGGGLGFHSSTTNSPMGFGSVIGDNVSMSGQASGEDIGYYSYKRAGVFSPLRMGSGDIKSGGIGFAAGATVADAVAGTQLPFIDTSGVLTPAQIQQQVNSAYARNDAKTNSETLSLIESMTGRGFSANSPILAALRVGLTGQNLRSSILAEQSIRLEGAKANAEQVLNSQKALSDQFLAQEGVLVDEQKNDVTRTVGIIQAISSLVGSAL